MIGNSLSNNPDKNAFLNSNLKVWNEKNSFSTNLIDYYTNNKQKIIIN